MDYRCNTAFTATTGTHYYGGQEIYSSEYYGLTSLERNHFSRIYEESTSSYSSSSSNDDYSSPLSNFNSFDSSPSYDSSSSNDYSSSDFGGFGGGDSGGGGADSNW